MRKIPFLPMWKRNVNGMRKKVTSYITSSLITLRDDGYSSGQIYEKYIPMFSSANDQLYNRKKLKEPLEYFLDYCALNDECFNTISFRSYYNDAIGCLFLNP